MTDLITRKRVGQLIAAAAIGAIVGFVVYTISRVTGRNLYIILGALAAAAALLVLPRYWRNVQLTQVTTTVPLLGELTFTINDDARQVAWKLYIETATRVSTQALSDQAGFMGEALASLYGLFQTTRDLLKGSRPSVPVPGAPTVEYLAVTMLNRELRPFLSKWHPRLSEWEKEHPDDPESDWPDNAACRDELRPVQANLLDFALAFARLADVRDARAAIVAPDQPGA